MLLSLISVTVLPLHVFNYSNEDAYIIWFISKFDNSAMKRVFTYSNVTKKKQDQNIMKLT